MILYKTLPLAQRKNTQTHSNFIMASPYCTFLLVLLMISTSVTTIYAGGDGVGGDRGGSKRRLVSRECNEIYVVREGETLHTISDKCNDLFILENNPQIQEHDDVFPGLVLKISPTKSRKLL